MALTDAFPPPITQTIGGAEVVFQRLAIKDYSDWISRLHAQQKVADLKFIPQDATPAERFEMARKVNRIEPSLSQIADMVWTLAGAKRILTISLGKSGKATSEADEIISQIRPRNVIDLAVIVSDLFNLSETSSPNARGPAPENAGSTETGSSSECSSKTTDAEIPGN